MTAEMLLVHGPGISLALTVCKGSFPDLAPAAPHLSQHAVAALLDVSFKLYHCSKQTCSLSTFFSAQSSKASATHHKSVTGDV